MDFTFFYNHHARVHTRMQISSIPFLLIFFFHSCFVYTSIKVKVNDEIQTSYGKYIMIAGPSVLSNQIEKDPRVS